MVDHFTVFISLPAFAWDIRLNKDQWSKIRYPRMAHKPPETQEDFKYTNTFKRNKDNTYDVLVTLADIFNSTRNTEYKMRDERTVQELKDTDMKFVSG